MGKIIDLESRKPHVMIPLPKRTPEEVKTVHVVPLSVFQRIAEEEIPVTDLECWERIIPVIIKEWLSSLGAEPTIFKPEKEGE